MLQSQLRFPPMFSYIADPKPTVGLYQQAASSLDPLRPTARRFLAFHSIAHSHVARPDREE